jgi:hypothetical protein
MLYIHEKKEELIMNDGFNILVIILNSLLLFSNIPTAIECTLHLYDRWRKKGNH